MNSFLLRFFVCCSGLEREKCSEFKSNRNAENMVNGEDMEYKNNTLQRNVPLKKENKNDALRKSAL